MLELKKRTILEQHCHWKRNVNFFQGRKSQGLW